LESFASKYNKADTKENCCIQVSDLGTAVFVFYGNAEYISSAVPVTFWWRDSENRKKCSDEFQN